MKFLPTQDTAILRIFPITQASCRQIIMKFSEGLDVPVAKKHLILVLMQIAIQIQEFLSLQDMCAIVQIFCSTP